ncbi:SLC13 family permease [Mycetohabitans endofungorum]|uniref:SLC13 family permease n=1 Tax=Mycetohabitans endofungorum TaxID=417203 RepID=UPI002B059751|nr:SLC13 family permease [Mycetohabitans endofungorum]
MRRVIVAVRRGFAKEPILATLVAAFVLLQCVHPQPWRTMPAQVDWQTVMTLAGLLMLTKAVEYSGFLTWASHRLVRRIHSERGLALWLVLLAAGLSTLLTNDVALFVVVPLMLSLHALVPLPVGGLVVLVALAVNAGSILTPFGNPQNLFLWQRSGESFLAFIVALAPLCAALMAVLVALTLVICRSLAFGVSVGGFGIAIGSLANLIAMRLVGAHGCWWRFHAISLPFYVLALLLGGVLL